MAMRECRKTTEMKRVSVMKANKGTLMSTETRSLKRKLRHICELSRNSRRMKEHMEMRKAMARRNRTIIDNLY